MNKLYSLLNKLFSDPAPAAETPSVAVKIPFLRIILDPYSLFIDQVGKFLVVGSFIALVMAVLSLSAGQGFMCIYQDYRAHGYCIDNVWIYGLVRIINLFLFAIFMTKWYQICYLNRPLNCDTLCRVGHTDLKTFATLLVFILLSLISALSLYLLIVRVPNPDWRIELLYFAVVSLGFWVPFLLIRFYSVFGFVMGGEKVPPLRLIWNKSAGNTLRLLCSISLLFVVSVFMMFGFMNNFRLAAVRHAVYISWIVEYLYNLMLLLLLAFFVNHCRLQQIYLFGRKDHGQ